MLRRWNATRPFPMRRPKAEAQHGAPFLDDLMEMAWPQVQAIGMATIREFDTLQPSQISALASLWDIFTRLPWHGQASVMGISKAVLLLTEGRIGPSLDSSARFNIGLGRIDTCAEWIACLTAISEDIHAFETTHNLRLEDLVPAELGPISVGRVYDMIVGPGLMKFD